MVKRLPHVLLIYRKMIPSIRLCGHCQMEELARLKKVEYRACQEMEIQVDDLNWADIVLLGRPDNGYEMQLVKCLHQSKRYLIYILDDDLLHIPDTLYSASYLGKSEIRNYIQSMIELSDAILSPSPVLLAQYATAGRKGILIEEPALDPIAYEEHKADAAVRVGFAGSVDRTGDIESILETALIRIKAEYGDKVEFEFFGAIPSFAEVIDARSIAYCNSYTQYRNILNQRQWDIGLAPIPDTPFHACKHYNKFIEYAASGIVGIYSAHEPYLRLQKKCEIGLFCENDPEAWYMSIKRLLDNRAERERLRRAACDYVNKEMSVFASAERFACQLPEVYEEKASINLNGIGLLLMKFRGVWQRGSELIDRYRWRMIPRVGQLVWQRCTKLLGARKNSGEKRI